MRFPLPLIPRKRKHYSVVEHFAADGWLYQARLVNCGKAGCSRCPHGPYWFELEEVSPDVWRSRYLGRIHPEDPESNSGLRWMRERMKGWRR